MKRICIIVYVLITVFYVFCMSGCGEKSHSKTNDEEETKIVVPVEVSYVKTGEIAAYFSGTATLEAEDETDVMAKVDGVVKKILVEEGDFVKAGKILAKLDDEKLAVQLEQASANMKKLEDGCQRNEELYKKKLISTEKFQTAKYEYNHQKAIYDLAKLNFNYTSIRSPIDGVVSQRNIKVGNMVLPNQATFRVTGLDPLIAVLHVPERQLGKLKVGHKAKFGVDAASGEEFTGCIQRICPVVDPSTGTVKVTIEIHDPSRKLKPGMFARLNIIYDIHTKTLLLPKDAIISEDKESSVFVVKDSVAIRKTIDIGYINTTHIEVLKGLQANDTVVTTGKGSLKDSSKVDIVSAN